MDFHLQLDVFSQFRDLHACALQMLREGVKLGGEKIGIGAALRRLGGEKMVRRAKNKHPAQDDGLASSWGHEQTPS